MRVEYRDSMLCLYIKCFSWMQWPGSQACQPGCTVSMHARHSRHAANILSTTVKSTVYSFWCCMHALPDKLLLLLLLLLPAHRPAHTGPPALSARQLCYGGLFQSLRTPHRCCSKLLARPDTWLRFVPLLWRAAFASSQQSGCCDNSERGSWRSACYGTL